MGTQVFISLFPEIEDNTLILIPPSEYQESHSTINHQSSHKGAPGKEKKDTDDNSWHDDNNFTESQSEDIVEQKPQSKHHRTLHPNEFVIRKGELNRIAAEHEEKVNPQILMKELLQTIQPQPFTYALHGSHKILKNGAIFSILSIPKPPKKKRAYKKKYPILIRGKKPTRNPQGN